MMHNKSKKTITEYEKKLKNYYWKCFISEICKVLFFLIIFIRLNLTTEYCSALFFLMILRINGGGLHFKHYISCLIVSFSFLAASIALALYVVPQQLFMIISLLSSLPVIIRLIPITSSNRPPATPDQVFKCKRNTFIIMIIFILLLCLHPVSTYLCIGYWTTILHVLQLIIAHIHKEVSKNV